MIITGHTFWRYHEWKITKSEAKLGKLPWDEVVNPVCDWCQDDMSPYDEENPDGRKLQTALHVILECDKFAAIRLDLFGTLYPMPWDLNPADILNFLHTSNIEVFPGEHEELQDPQRAAITQDDEIE